MTNPTEFAMFGKPGKSPQTMNAVASTALRTSPQVWDLLLSCARAGLDSGPILTPEQKALDALLTALMGAGK